MKKTVIFIFLLIVFICVFSIDAGADKVYEYELSDGGVTKAESKLSEFFESLPEDIKKDLPEKRDDFTEYDIEYFENKIRNSLKEAVSPAIQTMALLMGSIIVSSVFSMLADTVVGEGLKKTFSFCSCLCISLCVWDAIEKVLNAACALLDTLTQTMLLMIPAMEAVYISSGNLTGAAVSATGINLMISFGEMLFSGILSPCAMAVFIIAIVGALTDDRGVAYMTKTVRGIVTGAVTASMTLMTFVLTLQSTGAAAQDGFICRTVKFAIGNYLPIVGGAVADSFSVLSGSLNIIKNACGLGGIAVIVIAFITPFALIFLIRIAVGFAGAMAAVLGCQREGGLLDECKGICTLMLAVCSGGAVMYIIALGIFCKTPVSFG